LVEVGRSRQKVGLAAAAAADRSKRVTEKRRRRVENPSKRMEFHN